MTATDQTQPADPSPASPQLEELGRLAASVAHDFNNLLSVVLICAGEIADDATDPTQRQRAEEIREAAQCGAELTRRMLSHGRVEPAPRAPVALDREIAATAGLLERTLGGGVRLDLAPAADLPAVVLAPGELERILVNLAANSRDAMPKGGTVAIRTTLVPPAAGDPVLGGGWSVRISFSDDGSGMSPETAERAIEPFFTTKDQHDGTGLGLATVHGIARSAGGDVRINTMPGRGTSVSVYLPAVGPNGAAFSLPGNGSAEAA